MVLGGRPPGRVGRRRDFSLTKSPLSSGSRGLRRFRASSFRDIAPALANDAHAPLESLGYAAASRSTLVGGHGRKPDAGETRVHVESPDAPGLASAESSRPSARSWPPGAAEPIGPCGRRRQPFAAARDALRVAAARSGTGRRAGQARRVAGRTGGRSGQAPGRSGAPASRSGRPSAARSGSRQAGAATEGPAAEAGNGAASAATRPAARAHQGAEPDRRRRQGRADRPGRRAAKTRDDSRARPARSTGSRTTTGSTRGSAPDRGEPPARPGSRSKAPRRSVRPRTSGPIVPGHADPPSGPPAPQPGRAHRAQ